MVAVIGLVFVFVFFMEYFVKLGQHRTTYISSQMGTQNFVSLSRVTPGVTEQAHSYLRLYKAESTKQKHIVSKKTICYGLFGGKQVLQQHFFFSVEK